MLELVEFLDLLFVDIFGALLVDRNCRLGGLWLALLCRNSPVSIKSKTKCTGVDFSDRGAQL
jgi:hypothetical protein